jgi:CDP-2,3-bis-(O-geranylgeranyl)-sn-glycerol synthase
MSHDLLFALWFFAPAGLANVAPILANKVPGWERWQTPLDFGLQWRGRRLLGDHKTWRGLISGLIAGTLALWLQVTLCHHSAWLVSVSRPLNYATLPIIRLGLLMSFGALIGDGLKSFFKRQLNVISGHSWFPFDQLDYVAGGLLLSALVVRLPAVLYAWITVTYFMLHLLFSYLGYLLKLKDRPI